MKTTTVDINFAHVSAALTEYLRRYYPNIESTTVNGVYGKDDGLNVTLDLNNKKVRNVQKDSSVYDTLPCDVEP